MHSIPYVILLVFSDNPDHNIFRFLCLAVAALATVRICRGIETRCEIRNTNKNQRLHADAAYGGAGETDLFNLRR